MSRPRIEQAEMKLILADLAHGPATIHDLQAVVKIVLKNVRLYMHTAHRAGLVHIIAWERAQGGARAVWKLGQGRDASRIPPLDRAQRTQRWNESRRVRSACP